MESKIETKKQLIDEENWFQVGRGGGWGVCVCEMGEGDLKIKNSSCKINKSWGYKVQHSHYTCIFENCLESRS